MGYHVRTVTYFRLLGVGLGVVLCALTAAMAGAQTSQGGQETEQPPQQAGDAAAQHVPKPEAFAAYAEGQAAYKRKDMANAARAFESAVKLDAEFGIAWVSLGRTRMALRQPEQAEAAFRRFLELVPDNAYALADLGWALVAEKKYVEAIEVMRKQLAINPDAGDVYQRIGDAYMQMRQPERAIPELQKAVSLLPENWGPYYQLAQAYMRTEEYDKAAAAYERAFALNDVIGRMNDAAYAFAERRIHLDLAEKWATHVVKDVELELSEVKMPLDALSMQRASALAGFWDTLGFVKLQEGDYEAAEKFVSAGAQFVPDSAGSKHLGEIYEAQGRRGDAEEAYAEALALVPAGRELLYDEKMARQKLARQLGDEQLIEDRVRQARVSMEARRSVPILNPSLAVGLVQYVVIIGPGSKVLDMQAMTADDPLSALREIVKGATVPQAFPDETTQRLPRTATLSCPRVDLPCQLTLMPTAWGVRAQSLIAAPGEN
ncbi:MAG: tetratricopeptide repeat protein [Candidatus Acidiferrales bacterium]